jgi:hypothetical protein
MRPFDRRWICALLAVLPVLFSACGSSSAPSTPTGLAVVSVSLVNGTVGLSYAVGLQATGGTTPYTWSISGGSLPSWAMLNATAGAITGTPDATGTTSFTVQVADSAMPPAIATQKLSITVTPPPLSVSTNALPSGMLEIGYSTTVLATGGTTPYTWSITAGSLPVWASLAASTGVISGTPNATGTSTFTMQVADSETPPMTATQQFSISVPLLSVTSILLPDGTVGKAYSTTLTAAGGQAPYTWSISAGSLPAWAALDPLTGIITGTPNTAAITNFTVQVADSERPPMVATLPLSITVPLPALSVNTTMLPLGAIGIPYATTVAAIGGVTPYTWIISSGALPSWASLDPNTGIITGTPTATGTTTFTVQATDSEIPPLTATKSLSITINDTAMNLNSELSGQYGFLVQGFDDGTGGQFATVGSFVADGNGNITKGEDDQNGPGGYKPAVTFTGTYTVGYDNRGTMTISDSLGGSSTFAFAVGSIASGVASKGAIIEFDDTTGTSGHRGAGNFCLQSATSFGLSSITGPYAFLFAGQDSTDGTRMVTTGAFAADGAGNLTNGEFDANDNGTVSNGSFTASLATTTDTVTFGRVTITFAGGASGTSVVYIVTSSQLLSMGSGVEAASGLSAGQVLSQPSSGFTNASLNSATLFYTQGLGTTPGDSLTTIGLATFDGAGNFTFTLDQNDSGVLSPQFGSGTYSVAGNGRTPLAGTGTHNPILYLTSSNQGFFLSTGGDVGAGVIEQQSVGPFSAASISGNYYFGNVPPSRSGAGLASGIFTSTGNGSLIITSNQSNPNGLLPGVSLTDKLTIGSNGRATDTLGNIFYILSSSQLVSMGSVDPDPVITTASQ